MSNPTPEQQRQEISSLARLLKICKEDVLPHDYGITDELVDEAAEELQAVLREHNELRKAIVAFKKWDDAEGEKSPKSTTFDERCGLYALAAEKTEFALSSIPSRPLPKNA